MKKGELFKALYFGELSEMEVNEMLDAYRTYCVLSRTLGDVDIHLKVDIERHMSEDEKRKVFVFEELDAGRIENKIIPIIKAVRNKFNLGLKEAKDWCDANFKWKYLLLERVIDR